MPQAAAPSLQNPDDERALSPAELIALVRSQASTITDLQHQLEWFKRQLFGSKSERFAPEPNPAQLHLGEELTAPTEISEPRKEIPAHMRRVSARNPQSEADALPFFDESRVPVETIELESSEIKGLAADQYEVIDRKVSYRLAQRPGSYVVLKYVRPVIRRRDTQVIHCPPAPVGVLEGSRADVSFIAGLLIEKFSYHCPLYRQHQKLTDAGITVSRPWLTQLTQRTSALLAPIYAAQLDSIRASRVKAMDETPIKAGRSGHGKMKTAYFWPIYGERDEICFAYFPSRAAIHVREALGSHHAEDAVLLSDGYAAYQSYAKKLGLTHAQCWAHTRRVFFEAQALEPDAVREALEQIQVLYEIEADIHQRKLADQSKRMHRMSFSKPKVDAFFEWIDRKFERQGLLPSSPFTQALSYARERRLGLEVFLEDPDVAIDTNHLERALRVIPMGRRNWLFCSTELGAEHVGIVQSLIVTCRLHEIDPYTYLVDVLQRVGQHPAASVAELTPRLWKQHFAANPLRSDLSLAQ
jgi:transposase